MRFNVDDEATMNEIAKEAIKEAIMEKKQRRNFTAEQAAHLRSFQWKKGISPNPGGKPKRGQVRGAPKWTKISKCVRRGLVEKVAERIASQLLAAASDKTDPNFIPAVKMAHDYSEGLLVAKAEVKGTVQVARMAVVGLSEEEAARVALDFGTEPVQIGEGTEVATEPSS